MNIFFKSNKLKDKLSDPLAIKRAFGTMAKAVNQRILEMKASDNLEVFMTIPAAKCHLLTGQYSESFAATITKNFRIVFEPAHDPIPTKADKGIDLRQITDIRIISIEDYH